MEMTCQITVHMVFISIYGRQMPRSTRAQNSYIIRRTFFFFFYDQDGFGPSALIPLDLGPACADTDNMA